MSSITMHMRDGTTREFKHEGRSGGSYTKRLSYEPGFAVVTDEYGGRTSIPVDLIAEIKEYPERC